MRTLGSDEEVDEPPAPRPEVRCERVARTGLKWWRADEFADHPTLRAFDLLLDRWKAGGERNQRELMVLLAAVRDLKDDAATRKGVRVEVKPVVAQRDVDDRWRRRHHCGPGAA